MASVPFNNLITFSRGSNATVTGSNGLIQWAPNNLLTFSEQFDNAAWGKDRITVTANSASAPDGTMTAEAVVPTAVSGTHGFGTAPSVTITSGITYAASVYAKASGYNFFRLRVYNGSSNLDTYFDLSTGAVATIAAGVTATIQDGGNGWYRCVCVFTAAATAAGSVFVVQPHVAPSDGTASFTGDGTSGIRIWGAQLELGSTATTYNPTTVKNLLGFSEAFDNAAWNKTRVSMVTGAQANPVNGAFNAQKLMEDTANAEHIVRVNIALPTITGVVYGYSVYAKAAGRTQIRVTDNNVVGATFTLSGTGSTSNISGGVTASINQLADGWYRCFISVAAASVNGRIALYLVSSGNTTYTGDGNSGVYIYGAQLSDSASLDAYVPTPGAAPSSTAYYGPRFDYDPVTLAPKGILVEEARTNLVLQSGDGSGWAVVGTGAVTSSTGTAPDGSNNAFTVTGATDVVVPTGGNNVYKTFVVSPSTTYTISLYVKAITATTVSINIFDGGTGGNTSQAIALTSGWQRVQVSRTSAAGTTAMRFTIGAANGTVLCWGAQAEAGAFATSYIPTIASTVTRSADVATITGSLFGQWYGQSEGTFVVDFDTPQDAAKFVFSVSDGTNNNRIQTLPWSSRQGQIVTGGVDQALFDNGTITLNTPTKIALTYKANDAALSLGGAAPATDTSSTIPSIDRLLFGNATSGTDQASGHIRSVNYYPVRLADFQLQGLTELPLVPTLDLDFLNNLYEA